MTPVAAIPMIGLSLAAFVCVALAPRLHPATAARLLTLLTVGASVSANGWLLVVAGAFALQITPLGGRGHWELLLAAHGPVPPWLGVAAVALLATGAARTVLLLRSSRRARRALPRGDGIVVANDDAVVAVAVPGIRSRIVLSRGLLQRLPAKELSVVLAHERSHLRHHHGAFATASSLSTRFSPWLLPVARPLRFLLERWADEDAALAVGDRRIVARAISRAALDPPPPQVVLAFGDRHVVGRVHAMLRAAPAATPVADCVALATTTLAATGMAGSALQLHHALGLLG